MKLWGKTAAPLALGLALASCASAELGYDPITGTSTAPTRHTRATYRIDCARGAAYCLERAEAICGGPYRIIGAPTLAPRVQAVVHWQMTTVNADNPSVIYVACG